MSLSRRDFLNRSAAAGLVLIGSTEMFTASAVAAPGDNAREPGYGPLIDDPAGVLALPAGFSYAIVSRADPGALAPPGVSGSPVRAVTRSDPPPLVRCSSGVEKIHAMLLYRGSDSDEFTDEHEGWVAGRLPDGSLTGIWTDVRSCAERAFSAFLPRCECGWAGTAVPATPGGYNSAERQWRIRHLPEVIAERPTRRSLPEPACVQGSFVPER